MTDERAAAQKHAAKGAGLIMALAVPFIIAHEGRKNVAYADSIAVSTVCVGHTGPEIRIGDRWSDERCDSALAHDLDRTWQGIAPCVHVPVPAPAMAAFVSFAFNVGPAAFCRSTIARKLNAGDLRGACVGLGAWVFAGGRKIKGLANRRADETALCLKGAR